MKRSKLENVYLKQGREEDKLACKKNAILVLQS